jgi:hypothetical protein
VWAVEQFYNLCVWVIQYGFRSGSRQNFRIMTHVRVVSHNGALASRHRSSRESAFAKHWFNKCVTMLHFTVSIHFHLDNSDNRSFIAYPRCPHTKQFKRAGNQLCHG